MGHSVFHVDMSKYNILVLQYIGNILVLLNILPRHHQNEQIIKVKYFEVSGGGGGTP